MRNMFGNSIWKKSAYVFVALNSLKKSYFSTIRADLCDVIVPIRYRYSCRREAAFGQEQCDQIGRFIELWATFQCIWKQLICPNPPHSEAIFVKVSKSLIFLMKSFLGNFYRHLALFIWSRWSRASIRSIDRLTLLRNIEQINAFVKTWIETRKKIVICLQFNDSAKWTTPLIYKCSSALAPRHQNADTYSNICLVKHNRKFSPMTVVVVKWSACSPYTSTIWVRIPLKTTIIILYIVWKQRK